MPENLPAYLAPTFAERRAAREAAEKSTPEAKAVDPDDTETVENKTVTPKKTTRKTAKKA